MASPSQPAAMRLPGHRHRQSPAARLPPAALLLALPVTELRFVSSPSPDRSLSLLSLGKQSDIVPSLPKALDGWHVSVTHGFAPPQTPPSPGARSLSPACSWFIFPTYRPTVKRSFPRAFRSVICDDSINCIHRVFFLPWPVLRNKSLLIAGGWKKPYPVTVGLCSLRFAQGVSLT